MSVTDDFERPQPLVSYLIETHGSTIAFGEAPPGITDDFERDQPLVSYLIETHGSTIEFFSPVDADALIWDDPVYKWDDATHTWGGAPAVIPPGPAFEGIGFQADAFPTSVVNDIVVDVSLPAITQSATGRSSSGIVQITSVLPAFTQELPVDVVVFDEACSELGSLTQAAVDNLTVFAHVGDPVAPWQDDAFQPNAFRTVASHGQILPALEQQVIAFKLGAGEAFAEQTLPKLTTAAEVAVTVSVAVASDLPALIQASEAASAPAGAIASTLPAFTQHFAAAVFVAPSAGINQTLPALRQSWIVGSALWPEWPVSTGDEWKVRVTV